MFRLRFPGSKQRLDNQKVKMSASTPEMLNVASKIGNKTQKAKIPEISTNLKDIKKIESLYDKSLYKRDPNINAKMQKLEDQKELLKKANKANKVTLDSITTKLADINANSPIKRLKELGSNAKNLLLDGAYLTGQLYSVSKAAYGIAGNGFEDWINKNPPKYVSNDSSLVDKAKAYLWNNMRKVGILVGEIFGGKFIKYPDPKEVDILTDTEKLNNSYTFFVKTQKTNDTNSATEKIYQQGDNGSVKSINKNARDAYIKYIKLKNELINSDSYNKIYTIFPDGSGKTGALDLQCYHYWHEKKLGTFWNLSIVEMAYFNMVEYDNGTLKYSKAFSSWVSEQDPEIISAIQKVMNYKVDLFNYELQQYSVLQQTHLWDYYKKDFKETSDYTSLIDGILQYKSRAINKLDSGVVTLESVDAWEDVLINKYKDNDEDFDYSTYGAFVDINNGFVRLLNDKSYTNDDLNSFHTKLNKLTDTSITYKMSLPEIQATVSAGDDSNIDISKTADNDNMIKEDSSITKPSKPIKLIDIEDARKTNSEDKNSNKNTTNNKTNTTNKDDPIIPDKIILDSGVKVNQKYITANNVTLVENKD